MQSERINKMCLSIDRHIIFTLGTMNAHTLGTMNAHIDFITGFIFISSHGKVFIFP